MKDGAVTLVILITNTKKRQKLKKGAYLGVRGDSTVYVWRGGS
jgi:hypothetical protein